MEVFLGVLCVILLFVAYETLKLKQKQKENERRRKTGPPRKSYRKTNKKNGAARGIN